MSNLFIGLAVDNYGSELENSDYPPLKHARKSLEVIAKRFRSFANDEHEVWTFLDQDADLKKGNETPEALDRVWFAFVGHGTPDELVLSNSIRSISPQELSSYLQSLNAKEVVVTIDACHSGGFGKKLVSYLSESQTAFLVIASTGAEDKAWEDNELSATCFTSALSSKIRYLSASDPFYGLEPLLEEIAADTTGFAFGLKRGAKQEISYWQSEKKQKSFDRFKLIRRRVLSIAKTTLVTLLICLIAIKMSTYRYGVTVDQEIVLLRGPKFLSFTEQFISILYPGHSDVLIETGWLSNAQYIEDREALNDQTIWGIRGRTGKNGLSESLNSLLDITTPLGQQQILAYSSDIPLLGEFPNSTITYDRDILVANPNQPIWPSAEEMLSMVPKCGKWVDFNSRPNVNLQTLVWLQRSLFSHQNLNETNWLILMSMYHSWAGGMFQLSIGDKDLYFKGLERLVLNLETQRGRLAGGIDFSAAEADQVGNEIVNWYETNASDVPNDGQCGEYLEYFLALLGHPVANFERDAWTDFIEETEEIITESWRTSDPDKPKPVFPAKFRLAAVLKSGNFSFETEFLDNFVDSFAEYNWEDIPENAELTDVQRAYLSKIEDLSDLVQLPANIVDAIWQVYTMRREERETRFWDELPEKADFKLLWLLASNSNDLQGSEREKLIEAISTYEAEAYAYIDKNVLTPDLRDTGLINLKIQHNMLWAKLSKSGPIPDDTENSILSAANNYSDWVEISPNFAQAASDPFFATYFEAWDSTHPKISSLILFAQNHDISNQLDDHLRRFLTELDTGKIPNREQFISPGTPIFEKMSQTDPYNLRSELCHIIGKDTYGESTPSKFVSLLRDEMTNSFNDGQWYFEYLCPSIIWASYQEHKVQAEIIALLRKAWKEEEFWPMKSRLGGLISSLVLFDNSMNERQF